MATRQGREQKSRGDLPRRGQAVTEVRECDLMVFLQLLCHATFLIIWTSSPLDLSFTEALESNSTCSGCTTPTAHSGTGVEGQVYTEDVTFNVYTGADGCQYVNVTCNGLFLAVIFGTTTGGQTIVCQFQLY